MVTEKPQGGSRAEDPRRLSRLSRRLRMRSAGQLQRFERHAVQRRSMPEIQRADLVYLRMPADNAAKPSRSEEGLDGCEWNEPRTEFERTYFGDIPDNQPPSRPKANSKLEEEEEDELSRRPDDYVVPHNPEFRTSRDRLHEIFEHNRYLRRKFFADLPAMRSDDGMGGKEHAPVKFQADCPKPGGLGFGSTETLTSQSNQSAGSSTDGRKSRAEFDTPDKEPEKTLTYFGTDRYGGTWRSATGKPDSDGDTKYFASYVRVTESSSSEEEEEEGRDDAWAGLEIGRGGSLRGSRSLLELSVVTSHRRETRIERMIRRRGQGANRSCGDLSSLRAIEGDAGGGSRLVSPRLVGDALAASRERIAEEPEEVVATRTDKDGDCWGQSAPTPELPAGTTLASVYGPIPYKSPRRYVEGEVTIHYRSPVRSEAKEPLSEEELARRSADNMRRVYQEERRRKYLQELHDIDSRRHTDNFVPSQKSPIPLNRYDDFVDDLSYRSRSQEQTPEPRLVARALYNFVGQTQRELTFRRGDLIFVRRQVDKNWYEGEHNAMVGLFPFNYVEIIPYDEIRTLPKKSYEGQARAKFNFIAQTNLELSLAKGELVCLTRRVDENWWEGRVGNRKGIFPVSYVDVLSEPGPRPETPIQNKPVASPAAHSMLSNGTSSGKLSMGAHHYSPTLPVSINTTQPHYNSLPKGGVGKLQVAPVNETLHVDTHSEPIPYRALYNYRPQNEDELELNEGDTVFVMEKCDDGWYVGSSQRTGYFGTFPGNYVERL